jgi:hypothetical protein
MYLPETMEPARAEREQVMSGGRDVTKAVWLRRQFEGLGCHHEG